LLINPVISFTDLFGHTGSRTNLIGDMPTQAQIDLFSNELHITSKTPPAFLIHADTDVVVKVENSLAFYSGLRKHGVSGELHIYSTGEHGFLTAPSYDEWFGRCVNWMKSMRLLSDK
jgi:dipeptidyl aminopeptidase/acylaminoacyl peptidase